MKFEEIRFDLTPRTIGHCLDLSLTCVRESLPLVTTLVALTMIPVAIVSAIDAAGIARCAGWNWPLGFCLTGPLGVCLTSATVETTFGQTPGLWGHVRRELSHWKLHLGVLLLRPLLLVIGLPFLGLPALYLAVRLGFWTEDVALGSLLRQREGSSATQLVTTHAPDLRLRLAALVVAWVVLTIILFLTADFAITLLTGLSVGLGRLDEIGGDARGLQTETELAQYARLVASDPLLHLVLAPSAFAAYCITRLAWYFSYIDLRVRCDLWDVELQMLEETRRLEEAVVH